MSHTERIAKFDVDTGLLKSSLHMPDSAVIVKAVLDYHSFGNSVLRLTVVDDALPLADSTDPPLIEPTVTRHEWNWNTEEDSDHE